VKGHYAPHQDPRNDAVWQVVTTLAFSHAVDTDRTINNDTVPLEASSDNLVPHSHQAHRDAFQEELDCV